MKFFNFLNIRFYLASLINLIYDYKNLRLCHNLFEYRVNYNKKFSCSIRTKQIWYVYLNHICLYFGKYKFRSLLIKFFKTL